MSETIMKSRRGNPNWGHPNALGLRVPPQPTAFEIFLDRAGVPEDQAHHYLSVRQWVRKHRNSHFIPEDVLRRCGMDVELED